MFSELVDWWQLVDDQPILVKLLYLYLHDKS
jgi:hypothetical protein